MKNKKIILLIMLLIVVIICSSIYFYTLKDKALKLNEYEIANIEKVTIDIPQFTILVTGIYDGSINELDLKEKNVQTYKFDGAVYNGWDVVTNNYTGVKLKDVLNGMNITDYSEIEFKSGGRTTTTYDKNDITDKTYLIFYRDDKILREYIKVSLISFDYKYCYSLENVVQMVIK